MIRNAEPRDSNSICEIYNHYILNTHATFETSPVDASEMTNRVQRVQNDLRLPWIVKEEDGDVVGYAYATQWKPRAAYGKTVETTVYLHPDWQGRGLGKQLYGFLIDQLKREGYHALLGGISMPNEGSIKLHERMGFENVGQLREVGYKLDRWIDVGYWELVFKS